MPDRLTRILAVGFLAVLLGLACNTIIRRAVMGTEEPPALEAGATSHELGRRAPEVVATGLEVPWEIRFLPDGDLLVSERPGRLTRLSPRGETEGSWEVPGVAHVGEAGLMGLALDPDFATNRRVYVCFTTRADGGLTNRVERYRFQNGLSRRTPLITGMAGARFHDGCRLEFGPDGFLYATMGDAGDAEAAQDPRSLSGKILRVRTDGGPAPGNPFGNRVHSYGHRNPQGLAFDDAGRLWSTEHGPSGVGSGFDELNLVVRGSNYGWPRIRGDETAPGMVGPVVHSGSGTTWAPGGASWSGGSLFFGALRGQALYEARIPPEALQPTAGRPLEVTVVPHFFREHGRIRAVRGGPDGRLYFGTSNRDGRGRVHEGDDRILVVDPSALR